MVIINGDLIGPTLSKSVTSATQNALSAGIACFTSSFSGVTTFEVTHNLGSEDLVVEFRDSGGNFLVPDNWTVSGLNQLAVEFSGPTTGDLVILACIESGLAPITGGVTLLEGLSGIIDLDCPDGSVNISTSGQVINICALFTPASGAVLEQKCRDIITLSGLIGGGSGNPVDSRPATGVIAPNADCAFDLGTELLRWRALYACSGLFRDRIGVGTSEPLHGIHVSGSDVQIETTAIEDSANALGIDINANGFNNINALHINYETGAIQSGVHASILVDINNSEATGGAHIGLAVLAASGQSEAFGLVVGPRVNPVFQVVGSELTAMDTGLVNAVDETADLLDPDIDTSIFVANGDTVTIGSAAQFFEIFVKLTLGSSGGGVKPIFEFSTGVGSWEEFHPLDGTDGFRDDGSIVWRADSVPDWVVGTGSEFLIRITRDRNQLQATPIASQINISPTLNVEGYFWNKDGVVRIAQLGIGTTTPPDSANAIETLGNIRTSGHVHPLGDCIYDLGTTADRWGSLHACSGIVDQLFATSGNFRERPSVTGADGATSGIAFQQENFYQDDMFAIDLSAGITFGVLVHDAAASLPFQLIPTQAVKLHPYFSVLTQHLHASLPSEWVIELIKRPAPGAATTQIHVASGFFRWNPAIVTNEITWRQWETAGGSGVLLEPSVAAESIDSYGILVHNNGSGTAVDGVAIRASIGWTTHTNL